MNRTYMFAAPRFWRILTPVVLAGLWVLSSASSTQAGCAVTNNAATPPAIPFVSPHGVGAGVHQDDDDWNKHASIVGLWHVIYTAETASPSSAFPPTPFQFVESFKTWHADGTEFENAVVPPTGGNICFGVWKEESHGTVKLHHIGLMFDSMGRLANIFTDDEKVRVAADGKTYSASFVFKLWPPSFDAVGVGNPLSEVTGKVAATRITVD